MFKKWIGFGIFIALASMVVNFLPPTQEAAYAAGESYNWQGFRSIGAKGGDYNALNSNAEGDAQAVLFTMSDSDPNTFVNTQNTDQCRGDLRLVLPAENTQKARLTIPAGCPALRTASTDPTARGADVVIRTAESHGSVMRGQFMEENCKEYANDDAELKRCNTAALRSYEQKAQSCKDRNDYEKATQYADRYLDCLSEELCVERPSDAVTEKKEPNEEKTKCALPHIGWILCQILQLQAWVTDSSFDLFTGLMTIDPLTEEVNQTPTTPPGGTPPAPNTTPPPAPAADTATNDQLPNQVGTHTATYTAWRFFLGFTNLVFVAVFLIIIYSYITGWGLSTYNLKVMTPRFIVTILLVNMSFMICAITIDISNILGRTIRDTLQDITPPQVAGSKYTNWTQITNEIIATEPTKEEEETKDPATATTPDPDPNADQESSDETLSARCQAARDANAQNRQNEEEEEEQGEFEERDLPSNPLSEILMGGAMLAGTVAMFAMLLVLIPSMTVVLCALILVLILLLVRQAAVIVLVIISPLAFALNTLPGTKSWFQRWIKSFFTLVMLYPALSLIFGAAYIASHIIQDRGLEYGDIFIVMFSFLIQMLPFFFLPALMKLGGGAMAKTSDLLNSDRSPFSKVKKLDADRLEGKRMRKMGEAAAGPTPKGYQILTRMRRRRAKINSNRSTTQSMLGSAEKLYKAQATQAMAKNNSSEAAEEASALAAEDINSVELNTINAQAAQIVSEGGQADAKSALMRQAEDGGDMDDITQAAHMLASLNHAQESDIYDLIAQSGNMSDAARRVLTDHLRKTGFSKRNAQFGGAAMQRIEAGEFTSRQQVDQQLIDTLNAGKLSAESLPGQSDYMLSEVSRLQRGLSREGYSMLRSRSRMATNDPKLRNRMSDKGAGYISRFGAGQ